MHPPRIWHAALAAAFAACAGAGLARADDPAAADPTTPAAPCAAAAKPAHPLLHALIHECDREQPADGAHAAHPVVHAVTHPIGWAQTHPPLTCWADFNGYSCGSLASEAHFLFGSCRTFFGEPCAPGPPPTPWDPYPSRHGRPSCGCW
jgi:hypothetical protein